MNLIIHNSSMQPIYEQIMAQIKTAIASGELLPGTMLPSVRAMSRDLRISSLTAKKAYDLLEQEGYIRTVHGKGSFVLETGENTSREERQKEVEAAFEAAIRKGHACGISNEDMLYMVRILMED